MQKNIEHLSKEQFLGELTSIIDLLAVTFLATPPYQFRLHKPATEQRFLAEIERGTQANVTKVGEEIVGVNTYSEIDLDQINGEDLLPFATEEIVQYLHKMGEEENISHFVFLSRTFVSPDHQGQGIAHELRQNTLQYLREKYPDGVIVLTNHLSNNPAIIRSSEKLRFSHTNIGRCWVGTFNEIEQIVCDTYWVRAVKK